MHGYSDSEESDDPRRPHRSTGGSTDKEEKKKKQKKKPKAPPQQAINLVWKRFSQRKFSKALAVLPFDPVEPSVSSGRPNELLTSGYERAAEECRRKVKKIVQDCKRVNMRYRDVSWDLDWDLNMGKGMCLNGLNTKEFDLSSRSWGACAPRAVKRVHEIFEKPTFLKNVNSADVVQGKVGNCWLMAALSALASVEGGVQRLCVEYNTKIGIYGFVFYRDGEWIYSIIDDKLCLTIRSWDSISIQREILKDVEHEEDGEKVYRKTYQTGSRALYFGQCKDQNETWVPLLEKAYAKAHGDYASTSGGWGGEGLEDCSGGVTTEILPSDILDADEFWDNEMSKANKEFVFSCSTGHLDDGYGERDGISEAHAYVVMDTKMLKSGERLVKLRNPWGKNRRGLWTGKYSDGSKEWSPELQVEIGHLFGSDSVFWIPYENMLQKYQSINRTRLFREPGWRICQRFIGADVSWKPQWNEKFHIKLTRDSPMVLVLSQLDDRYFRGLEGQYTYMLHFRVHEQDRNGVEDYICRSNGDYLMSRGVAVEVPDMPAGNYTVFISISAERDTTVPSVEDVIKRETKARKENEKLAQVGHAYDLAHSKAYAHMQEVARQRREKERKRASDSRKSDRRKLWERRRVVREANRKQHKKNTDKNDKRREVKEGERKKKEEEEEKDAKFKDKAVQTGEDEESRPESKEGLEDGGAVEKTGGKAENEAEAEKPKEEHEEKPGERPGERPDEKPEEKPNEEPGKKPDEKPDEKPGEKPTTEKKPATDEKSKEKSGEKKSEEKGDDQPTPPTLCTCVRQTPPPPPPPPPPQSQPQPQPQPPPQPEHGFQQAMDLNDDSSDSPVSDYDDIYSDDDFTRKLRTGPPVTPLRLRDMYYDSSSSGDKEEAPDPWNAICVVGFRVYSHDENLELRVVMEGGELSEDGMGSKGAGNIEDAQACAGGERAVADAEEPKVGETAQYKTVVNKEDVEEDAREKTDAEEGTTKDTEKKDDSEAEKKADVKAAKKDEDVETKEPIKSDPNSGDEKASEKAASTNDDDRKPEESSPKDENKPPEGEEDKHSVSSREFDMCTTPESNTE